MKKRIKTAAGVTAVIVCILLGCEKKETEEKVLFLDQEAGLQEEFSRENEEAPENAQKNKEDAPLLAEPEEDVRERDAQVEETAAICVVHICGAVMEPGVYTMESGDRIYQAVERAGGFTGQARQDYLNQADLLTDGMKIYVPTWEEVEQEGALQDWRSPEQNTTGEKPEGTPVNINTADEGLLCTLPGVGSSKAKSIISYREKNGAYQSIEDIMKVEGIKDGMFQKLKDSITV